MHQVFVHSSIVLLNSTQLTNTTPVGEKPPTFCSDAVLSGGMFSRVRLFWMDAGSSDSDSPLS